MPGSTCDSRTASVAAGGGASAAGEAGSWSGAALSAAAASSAISGAVRTGPTKRVSGQASSSGRAWGRLSACGRAGDGANASGGIAAGAGLSARSSGATAGAVGCSCPARCEGGTYGPSIKASGLLAQAPGRLAASKAGRRRRPHLAFTRAIRPRPARAWSRIRSSCRKGRPRSSAGRRCREDGCNPGRVTRPAPLPPLPPRIPCRRWQQAG